MLRENPRVCVEVDEYDADGKGSWRSVIAHGTYEELGGDAIEPALALMRERFARTAGRAAEPRPLGPNVVVLRISSTRSPAAPSNGEFFLHKQGMRLCTEIEKTLFGNGLRRNAVL
jgi:hypothetical protein